MLFIVTPVFNRKEFTYNYLQSLREQTFNDFKVIIVDDGSTDGTSEMIKKDFSEVILIEKDGKIIKTYQAGLDFKLAITRDDIQKYVNDLR